MFSSWMNLRPRGSSDRPGMTLTKVPRPRWISKMPLETRLLMASRTVMRLTLSLAISSGSVGIWLPTSQLPQMICFSILSATVLESVFVVDMAKNTFVPGSFVT